MGVAFFYHLTRSPLEDTLPMLLAKARGVDWRVLVRGGSVERLKWLDEKLWLGPEDGFQAHGLSGGKFDAEQPILLTQSDENPNGSACLMCVDGAKVAAGEVEELERVCILFDGNDVAALEHARGQWKSLTDAGCAAQYWSQESGKWAMKAQSGAK